MIGAATLLTRAGIGEPTRAQLTQWAHMLRAAADALGVAVPNGPGMVGVSYRAAKSAVDQVADEMYAANDAMARAAWEQVLGKGAAS